MQATPVLPTAQILKVAEHGGIEVSGALFVGHVQPSLAVISAAAVNAYGHPRPEILDRLASAGATVLQTSRNGTITVTSDGTTFEIQTEREVPAATVDQDGCGESYPDFCILPPPVHLTCDSPEIAPHRGFAGLLPDAQGFDPDKDGTGCEA